MTESFVKKGGSHQKRQNVYIYILSLCLSLSLEHCMRILNPLTVAINWSLIDSRYPLNWLLIKLGSKTVYP